ncbi:MAG: hypothetical protein DRP08_07665 [Candidatus Aenigmatarchaeota archaeon]|nr:MAG: hypothetical protein DRP08_07665 [Candidatus Aenigmarchaeota archaeon]
MWDLYNASFDTDIESGNSKNETTLTRLIRKDNRKVNDNDYKSNQIQIKKQRLKILARLL